MKQCFRFIEAAKGWLIVGVPFVCVFLFTPPSIKWTDDNLRIVKLLILLILVYGYYKITGRSFLRTFGYKFNFRQDLKFLLHWSPLLMAIIALRILTACPFVGWVKGYDITLVLPTLAVPFFQNLYSFTLSGFVEEWYFRGFAYDVFNSTSDKEIKVLGIPVNYALICTSILFCAVHFGWQMLTSVIAAVLFGVVRMRTGNIFVPTILHIADNLFFVPIVQSMFIMK